MIRDGKLFKRREVSFAELTNKNIPNFEIAEHDTTTGKVVGWVPVGDGPEDRWHREALDAAMSDGTYELVGPKVQGNPERLHEHVLVRHGVDLAGELMSVPRDFDGLASWLASNDVEGIVFHHHDGRMAKIKGRDFGVKRGLG